MSAAEIRKGASEVRLVPLRTVDDLIADTLGKWCSRCQRVTEPYVGEGKPLGYGAYADVWPCCDGCWQRYPDG